HPGVRMISRGTLVASGPGGRLITGGASVYPSEISLQLIAAHAGLAAAQQFAQDSGASVGLIKSATQGYFSIEARDGSSGGWGQADSPFKKVRVVTTVNFSLD
ncbi:MAG: SIMPL domain-containing protein, partial [Pseudomonadota bacterium]